MTNLRPLFPLMLVVAVAVEHPIPANAQENPCAHTRKSCAQQCDDGNGQACLDLARVYTAEAGGQKSKQDARAAELLEQACDAKVAQGCADLGRLQVQGRAPGSWKGGLQSFKTACKAGVAAACEDVGDLLATGNAGKRDEDAALKAFETACTGGVLTACSKAGGFYCELEGEEANCKTFIEKGCRAPLGCGDLIQPAKTAAATYQAACDDSLLAACSKAGALYLKQGDFPKAKKAFGKACKAEVMSACTAKAQILLAGKGVEKEEDKAVELFKKACAAKDSPACRELGLLYLAGNAVDQDGPKGVLLLKEACAAKDASACTSLGWRLFNGDGVHKDVEGGKELLHQSCLLGSKVGCEHLKTAHWQEKNAPEEEEEETPRPRKKGRKRPVDDE